MKKYMITYFAVILLILQISGSVRAQYIYIADKMLMDLENSKNMIKTGDLFLWGSKNMDSVIIQKFTDGPYSHAGIIWRDSLNYLWLIDVHPGTGLRRQLLRDFLDKQRRELVSVAIVKYKGDIDREEIKRRLDAFWQNKANVKFDRAMALEKGKDFNALMRGEELSLYCTEFILRIYEGVLTGKKIFENDYQRVYDKKEILNMISDMDEEIIREFQFWLGLNHIELFEKWLTAHRQPVLISANGMIRSDAFEIIFTYEDFAYLKSGARKFLELDIEKNTQEVK